MHPDIFATLLSRYLKDELSAEELERFREALLRDENREQWQQAIDGILQSNEFPAVTGNDTKERIWLAVNQQESHPVWRRRIRPLMAAAAAIGILITAGIYLYPKPSKQLPATAIAATKPIIRPGGNKAILTLADGSQVTLDSTGAGAIATQGNTHIVQVSGGQLAYKEHSSIDAPPQFNSLQVPRGGQFRITLADGTNVWLNAASVLRYPASFANADRTVELTGEAYFEVAALSGKPFRVKVNNTLVQVLGTSFNIMGYSEEQVTRTTLLEGAVQVKTDRATTRMYPGQAATTQSNGETQLHQDADVDQVVAWKNGYFLFNHEKLPGVMRQIARWYDVEVEYAGKIPEEREFGGKIARSSSIEDVIRILKLSNIHVKLINKKIIVQP
ncbi:FecR family protein [Chitinophaga arvensicola]|uniref:FecR protein n=1 Tax=Chitinophaga arvensicola TaxID=29529 RepID=A0A1I0SAE1_9BACT|nr:FecR family protein [Chitinophaga arvensicola]SEW53456.1 FecR protein [Chitinophaga arvensicola]